MARKVYVDVVAEFDTDGNIKPLRLTWEDGTVYEIDRVLSSCRAASRKAGGIGTRYSCRIMNQMTFIWKEDDRWFVEGK